MRILFVCMGNICRSPTAEAVFASLLDDAGIDGEIEIDSAGTGSWHVGHPPDERSTAAAASRGITLTGAARQVEPADFDEFDLLVAMDSDNAAALRRMAPDDETRKKVVMLREYDPEAVASGYVDVPDPYYGGPDGFENVLDVVDRGARGLLDSVR